ncbi:MAG: DNA topoisomerase IV subunit A [Gammaproteobacteria bacterium]|nr:DNA topoisomerase IV subunit A [Rhodocyclaceae bacterium]MBU3909953.1 DNA topoisomerase IV subunit A [Gammaproteobacteria bacterium]MBU3987895.1 DNA topoisomerase IV subunit A [Gammaproteobacteria bacterium]MBU4003926.1 DNA topoisomerase IV subunit A [Gammaproteobacteria bacterium]MBU4020173.1 DNA topoisomerase IV subunit A [Gammaproteobacteria bacterium]
MSHETPDLFDDIPDVPPPPPAVENMGDVPPGAVPNGPGEPPDGGPRAPTFDDGTLPLDTYAERAYLAYAMSVVKSRALPQVEDGMKPVQRRILHAMNEMRLAATAKHVKSARVVGDVIGKFHPHGDSSIYDAMVRVAQDFSLRYPLVDGQGNFGSRDGDGAAAMRYTECRLTPIAELLLTEIDRGTVDFVPNYDGTLTEPSLLPARLPFVLLNGASGIAVGMATEIPPHNLREVADALKLLIRKPAAPLEEVLTVLPGPDFPGGGQLIAPAADIRAAYAGGRGSLRMRCRWRIEELARGQWRVIVYELPHGVSTAHVLSEIEAVTNPQPRTGKKDISQEQKNLKQVMLGVLDAVRDESNEKDPVRIVLEPKSSRVPQDEFMAVLLARTSLEANVSLNMTMIGTDGRPAQKSLLTILHEWIAFRHVTVERRSKHRLNEVERRLHILEGRMTAYLSIDKIIKTIRAADEPKAELMAKFNLSEIQAEDILEIRLRQLARLEGIKIEQEQQALATEAKELRRVLEDRGALTKLVVKEITEDAKKYGDARRTLIESVAPVSLAEVAIPDEPVTVILSENGWVRSRQGHGIDPASIAYKSGDSALLVMEARTVWPLVIIDTHGRAYSVRVADLPGGRGDGAPISTFVEFQEGGKLAQALTDAADAQYLFANSGGYGFIASIGDLVSRNRAGKAFMTLEKGELPLVPAKVGAGGTALAGATANMGTAAAISQAGRLLVFPVAEMKTMSKGRGLIIQSLGPKEQLVAVAVGDGAAFTVTGIGRGGKATEYRMTTKELASHCGSRARKGPPIASKIKPTGLVAG